MEAYTVTVSEELTVEQFRMWAGAIAAISAVGEISVVSVVIQDE